LKRARFVAAARREFLAEVVYYNNKQPGLGSRFAEAVKEATGRALAFSPVHLPPRILDASFSKTFHLRLYIGRPETASLSSHSRITCVVRAIYQSTEYFENKVLQKRPYLKKEWCIRVVEEPLRSEPQEHNRYRFWAACPELCGRYLRVVTLEDKVTIHNAFLDRGFKL
jgi:hypothetical protein